MKLCILLVFSTLKCRNRKPLGMSTLIGNVHPHWECSLSFFTLIGNVYSNWDCSLAEQIKLNRVKGLAQGPSGSSLLAFTLFHSITLNQRAITPFFSNTL